MICFTHTQYLFTRKIGRSGKVYEDSGEHCTLNIILFRRIAERERERLKY